MDALRLAVQAFSFTKQETSYIKNMTAQVRQNKLIQFGQKRLILENRITGNHIYAGTEWLADPSLFQELRYPPDRGLPTPVFVNVQGHTSLVAGCNHRLCDL